MRVLIVVPYFAPAWAYGGPPRVLFDLARGLVGRGHEVRVLTTDAFERQRRISLSRTRLDGIHVDYLPNLSNRLAWDQKIFLPLGFPIAFLRWLLWAEVVLLSDYRTFQNAVSAPVLRLLRKPFVLAAFGSLPLTPDWKSVPKRVFDKIAGNALLRDAGVLLAQSTQEAEQYRQFGASAPIALLPLALDLHEFDDLPPRGTFRRAHGIEADALTVLFLGRLHEYKGLGVLVDAFARVADQAPDARLVVAGRDDGYRATLETRLHALGIANRVTITGGIYGRDRLAAYVDADLFVLPATHQEETPLAGLEAMACGCPVVVSRQAHIPGLTEAAAGWEVDATPSAVASAILAALGNDGRRRAAGVAARRLIEERYSLEQRAAELEEILARVACKGRESGSGNKGGNRELGAPAPGGTASADSPLPAKVGERGAFGRYGQIYGGLPVAALRRALGPLPRPLLVLAQWYFGVFGFPDIAGQLRFPLVLRLLAPCPGDRVLDAGSGKGIYANTIASRLGATVVAAEMHPERLAEGATAAAALGCRARFTETNLERLGFADASFDCALCIEVLEHVPDDDRAIAEIARVLRPGGRLVLSVPKPAEHLSETEAAAYAARAWLAHVRDGYTPDTIARLFDRHGLRLEARHADWGAIYQRAVRFQQALYRRSPWLLNVALSPLLQLAAPVDRVFGRRSTASHGWVYVATKRSG